VSNCTFQKDDVEDEWVFPVPDNKFDYVHLRFMVSCFDHPRKVMTNAFNHLKPGGWVEYQDSVMPFVDVYGGAEGKSLPMDMMRMVQWASRYKPNNILTYMPRLGHAEVERDS
jgi:ubiquinone/menaquinone biosynthesis C-methylase UbiE